MNITKPRLDQFKITGTADGDSHFPKVEALLPFNGTNGATSTTEFSGCGKVRIEWSEGWKSLNG